MRQEAKHPIQKKLDTVSLAYNMYVDRYKEDPKFTLDGKVYLNDVSFLLELLKATFEIQNDRV